MNRGIEAGLVEDLMMQTGNIGLAKVLAAAEV